MFREPQGHFFEQSYEEERAAKASQPIECLGITFDNDDARRAYFLDKLRAKLGDPEFRRIEGCPIGDDDDILRLSDPPYHTACPNPFLADFVRHYGRQYDPNEPYHRTPFAVDVSEGKTDALYKAHSYHTKVPPKAIMRAILHYTNPGDLVLDGFCRLGHDRRRRAALRPSRSGVQGYRRCRVEGGRRRPAAVGRAPRRPQRAVAGGDVHRRQLQPAVRRRRLRPRCPAHPRRDRRGVGLDVRNPAHGRQDARADQLLPRQAQALAALWRKAEAEPDARLRSALVFFVEQAIWGMSVLNRYKTIMHGKTTSSNVNQYLSGVYYVPSQHSEVSPWYNLQHRLHRLRNNAFVVHPAARNQAIITTSPAQSLSLPENCIDYIFTDPPFGENIYYADLNFLVESWHRVRTDPGPEAIVDRAKRKSLADYQELMRRCLAEFYRVLNPGRWMTMVFHNSSNAVWNAIQEAMLAAGFVVADVRTLDKQQGSYRQVTSSAVKQDLVISAYKPNGGLEARFQLAAGAENGAWDFVRTHLGQLPVFVSKDGRAEPVAERQAYLLFDRMVAFHVLRGVTVPLSAAEFYAGLEQRFIPRDRMYFLPEQAAEYDRKRMTVQDVMQLELAVSDEASAIEWVRRELSAKPQTLQELTPKFMKEAQRAWAKHEKPLELASLLHDNFLCYDGDAEVPSQIHSYLSTNFKELRNREKDEAALRAKGKHRWYVPDPNKAQDLEKLRDRALLKEFWEYMPPGHQPTAPDGPQAALPGLLKPPPIAKGKRIKVLRTEAVRAGFAYCWKNRDYRTILAVAGRLPDDVLQEDPKLLMWYDQAVTRVGQT